MRTHFLKLSLIAAMGLLAACGASPRTPQQQITSQIPQSSPLAKIQPGMSMRQVHDLIGQPTDSYNSMTGKMFIPFYFGNDAVRMEELYKGQGRITYTGVGAMGASYNVYQITYDANEDGYNNR
ncbi:hypothetical protein DBR00_01595 [Pseudomonas sp. HMWF032]|uniref:hypothetical protein n=1 Tax=unclassified Pseudomonas TaxID=196821 RepID=UPI000D3B1CB1